MWEPRLHWDTPLLGVKCQVYAKSPFTGRNQTGTRHSNSKCKLTLELASFPLRSEEPKKVQPHHKPQVTCVCPHILYHACKFLTQVHKHRGFSLLLASWEVLTFPFDMWEELACQSLCNSKEHLQVPEEIEEEWKK